MARVNDGEVVLDNEEEVDNFIRAIKEEKVDEDLIKKALMLSKKNPISDTLMKGDGK